MVVCMTSAKPSTLSIAMAVSKTDAPRISRWKTTQGPLSEVANRAFAIAADGLSMGKSWSLAQICHHLAVVVENTVQGSGDNRPPKRWSQLTPHQRLMRRAVKSLMLSTGWFPTGAPAPESVQPPADISLEQALSRLRAATEAFDAKFITPGSSWGYHSLLGKMSGRAWRRFHHIHAAHHFSFLKKPDA